MGVLFITTAFSMQNLDSTMDWKSDIFICLLTWSLTLFFWRSAKARDMSGFQMDKLIYIEEASYGFQGDSVDYLSSRAKVFIG